MCEFCGLSAAVLAGGNSSRLGIDKTRLAVGGHRLLIEEVVSRVRQVSDDVLVVGGDPTLLSHLPVRFIDDARPGCGALGGLYSGLRAAFFERCLVVACDMPFLNVDLLRHMAIVGRTFDVVVPRMADYLEPLHAIYSRRCLAYVETLLDSGDLRIASLYHRARVLYLERAEIQVYDPELLSTFNINTQQQLRVAMRVASRLNSQTERQMEQQA